ncbi:hypothetical protein N7532_008305, partial [Penicillium argentinense]
ASKPIPTLAELDPISEDEEYGHEVDYIADLDSDSDTESSEQVLPLTQPTHIKKRAHSAIESQDDQSLPMISEDCTQGRSGRIRKRPKMPDGFEIEKI